MKGSNKDSSGFTVRLNSATDHYKPENYTFYIYVTVGENGGLA